MTFTQEPTDQTAQEETEHEILTLITTKVKEIEAEFQPLRKLFQALEISENLDRRINEKPDTGNRLKKLASKNISSLCWWIVDLLAQ